jgi:hypothetical protein
MNRQPNPGNFAQLAGDDPVAFLERLRPGGPWPLAAILPDPAPGEPPTITVTARDHRATRNFVGEHDNKRNLYYLVNSTRSASDCGRLVGRASRSVPKRLPSERREGTRRPRR